MNQKIIEHSICCAVSALSRFHPKFSCTVTNAKQLYLKHFAN